MRCPASMEATIFVVLCATKLMLLPALFNWLNADISLHLLLNANTMRDHVVMMRASCSQYLSILPSIEAW